MSAAWLMAAAFVPLVLALFSALPMARWLPLLAATPALVTAIALPQGSQLTIPWLLLGAHLQLDGIGQLFLLFSALMWLFASLFLLRAEPQPNSPILYRVFFLMAMSGNFLLIMAADMVTFYIGFALMGLSAYPMVLQRSQRARHAGRIYLTFTLIGELALFSAMALLFNNTGSVLFADIVQSPVPPIAIALLLFGFGIKVALPGLHCWLPMVYSSAPLITAAVLSGPMMKAGLMGWIRFIPVGQQDLLFWGELLRVLGVLGIALAVVVGVLQRDARAILGYSSIAKMGLISALFGQAMVVPEQASLLLIAIVLFAMHHLLVKSSLFLALFEWQQGARRWVFVIITLLAISLAGVPLSGGAAAKTVLKDALNGELMWLLSTSAVGTALLMARFIFVLPRQFNDPAVRSHSIWLWLLLLPLAFWGPYLPDELPVSPSGLGPLLLSIPLAIAGWWLGSRYPALVLRIPPGDMIHPLLSCLPRHAVLERYEDATADWKAVWDRLTQAPDKAAALVLPGLVLLVLFLLLLATLVLPLNGQ
jgi:formate hydrogenlyase subunit 3/multisubunit Na+/H+ antiporter MnhD subunit